MVILSNNIQKRMKFLLKYMKKILLIAIILAVSFSGCKKTDTVPNASKLILYGSPETEIEAQMIHSKDGGYYIFGTCRGTQPGASAQFLLLKTDEKGTLLWRKTYSYVLDIYGLAIIQKPDGGLLLCGN